MMATLKSSPTKHPSSHASDDGGADVSAAAAAAARHNTSRDELMVQAHVKQEPEDNKMEVAARLGLTAAFAERHLSGGDGTASGTSGRSSSANSAMTASPHSTPPPLHQAADVKPLGAILLANQSLSRTQNLSPGLSSSVSDKPSSSEQDNPDDKRINNNTSSYVSGGRLKFFKGEVCFLELAHRSDGKDWRTISNSVYWPPPGPLATESSSSVRSVSEAGSDVAHSPMAVKKNDEEFSPPSITSQSNTHHRLKSIPSKFYRQPQRVRDQLCFTMRPPPCIVTVRKKTKSIRKYRKNPYKSLPMGAAMMALVRFESQAVKSRPMRRPIDMDRVKKASRVYYLATSAASKIAKNPPKPKKPVIGPITPWKPAVSKSIATSIAPVATAATTTSAAAKRVIKSELCPVTETCTAATMPPSSPSTSKHKKAETRTTMSNTPGKSPRSLPVIPMPGRIRGHEGGPMLHDSASFVSQSPDFRRVKVEIAREQQHHIHRAPTAHIPLASSLPPDFTSPRKRALKDAQNSPSKRQRQSTDSRGSAGSSDGINSGTASPSLQQQLLHRVGSPGGPGFGVSPPRLPPPRSNSFSIESIMGGGGETLSSRPPLRPVAIPASPLRARSPSRSPLNRPSPSPPSTPMQHNRQSPVNVSVTPYARRGMDPSTPIDPRLAYLAGESANPSLGLRPTGGVGSPFPGGDYNQAMAAAAMMNVNSTLMYMAAAANASQLWAAQAASRIPVTPPSTAPATFGTPTRSVTPATERPASSTPFSPWAPQYRGAPKAENKSSGDKAATDAPLDLCIKRE